MSAPLKTDADRLADAERIIRAKNAEIDALKKAREQAQRDADTAEAIRREIWGLAARPPEPPKWLTAKGAGSGDRGIPITILSDIHYGERVDPEQIGGVNSYNAKIAKARLERYFTTIVDLAHHHMGQGSRYPGIVVCLGGDMIGGDIHEELRWTNDKTPHQAVHELTDLIAAGIEFLAGSFGKVFLPCVVGNHGRSTHKPVNKGRVFSNYDWSLYCNLERYFQRDKRIAFHVSSEADAHFRSFNTRYLLTHGDSLGVKGGDGIIGAIGPIMRGSLKLRDSEMQIGREFDVAVIGHWHQMLWLPNVIVNNSVKGYDEYAKLALRARYSRPSQALWFNHPDYAVTARWELFLEGRKEAAASPWVTWPKAASA